MKYLLFLMLFLSCTKEPFEHVGSVCDPISSHTTLVYYANLHFTNLNFPSTPMNEWSGTVVFTPSCRYICDDLLNQIDFNKLFGIRKSPLPTNLHRNGAYLAWSYPNKPPGDINYDKIRVGWYLHDDNSNVESMPIADCVYVNIDEPVHLSIGNYYNEFVFNLNGQTIYINKSEHNIQNFSNGWRLNPWSGGQETQDHNMYIPFYN